MSATATGRCCDCDRSCYSTDERQGLAGAHNCCTHIVTGCLHLIGEKAVGSLQNRHKGTRKEKLTTGMLYIGHKPLISSCQAQGVPKDRESTPPAMCRVTDAGPSRLQETRCTDWPAFRWSSRHTAVCCCGLGTLIMRQYSADCSGLLWADKVGCVAHVDAHLRGTQEQKRKQHRVSHLSALKVPDRPPHPPACHMLAPDTITLLN